MKMERSPASEALTIGELAALFGLATHVIRHWEAVGLVTPAARVNGRRRYHPEHITRIAMIVQGKEAGFGLAELREILDAPDLVTRRALVERHHAALERRIAEAQAAKEMVEHILDCPIADFTHCREFQRIVQRIAVPVPLLAPADAPYQSRLEPGQEHI